MNELLPFPWSIIVPILVAIIAAAPGMAAFVKQRRRSKAETADILTTAAERLVQGMAARIAVLTADVILLQKGATQTRCDLNVALEKVEDLERKNRLQSEILETCMRGIKALTAQLVNAGMAPAWTPPDLDKFA